MSTPAIVGRSVQEFETWLHEIRDAATLGDSKQAYEALRAVLHMIRDRMPPDEATDLGAQLPTLVRGVYYEAWAPRRTPDKARSEGQFLEGVRQRIQPAPEFDLGAAALAVFACLARHLDSGQVDQVINAMPKDVQALWPEAARERARARVGA